MTDNALSNNKGCSGRDYANYFDANHAAMERSGNYVPENNHAPTVASSLAERQDP